MLRDIQIRPRICHYIFGTDRNRPQKGFKKLCRDPGSNRGPLDLQYNALPTELSRLGGYNMHHWQHRNIATKARHSFDFTRWV
jgi:hypothetical protein